MENRIVTAVFKDSKNTKVSDVWQWDYGQILRIQGLDLPTAVEVDFAVAGASESIARIGTTKDGVTDVVIPDSLIETGNNLVAYIYLRDAESGNTEYQIDMIVTKRAKPEAYDTPEDKELFGQAIEAVNAAADRAEKAGKTAQEAATKTGQDAEQTAQDRAEVAKMVETVTDISEQVKKVEDLSNKAQAAATKTEADAQQTEEDRVEVGKMLETVKDVSEQVKTVEESVRKAKESEQAAEGHRTAVEEMKNSVEQTVSGITQVVQTGVQEINSAKQSAVQEVTQTGTDQKTAVEGAGTQAVENVENVKASATEAVETAKTEAVQSVQTEGNTQTGNVTAEGTKQVKAVQDKGNEVLQSIPEDFQMQMESKLDKQQGVENKGKALVIGEDGNVAPGEVQSGGGDGIAIINTMSGESPLVIPDSAERVNKRLELGGKTEQVQTTGAQLLPFPYVTGDMTKNGVTFAVQEDGGIKVTGTATEFVIFNIAKIDFGANSIFNNSAGNGKVLSGGKDNVKIEYHGLNKNTYLSIGNGLTVNTVIYPQLQNGTTATPYEPYTGGKPSPSPEYPQEIKNSGKWNEETRKYEVDIEISGNFFDVTKVKTKTNLINNGDGSLHVINKNVIGSELFGKLCPDLKVGETCVMRLESTGLSCISINGMVWDTGQAKTITQNILDSTVYFYGKDGSTVVIKNIRITRNTGKNMEYTPYRKPQLLTITSDRPITKWDRLVEQGGQIGWLYAGVVIDRFDGQSNKISIANKQGNVQNFSIQFDNVPNGNGNADIFIDKYRAVELSYTKAEYGICCNWNAGVKYFSAPNENVTTVDEFKAWLIENPLKIAYETTNSEFIPLPQSEQNAIRALKTYYPTTVITVDGGGLDPDIKVTYTADTKNYIDNKVSAKVASIIRQYRLNTANLLSLMPMETQAAMIENDTNNILENAEEMKHE